VADHDNTLPQTGSAEGSGRLSALPGSGEGNASAGSGERRQVLAGRYEILALLGVGGMGSVYRARDRELDELVALKMLRRELLDTPGILDRFRREVKLARRVTHRNVARVFDIGEHEGEKFLTMEFVDGESLGEVLARMGQFDVARALEIAGDVCAGLACAHAAGVVHRDLKPDNVLLAKDGRVVVTDFGIARALLDIGAAQTVGTLVGTPAYMAPEQVEGHRDIDARADIYALGALMYELFTGQRAWTGETAFMVAAARLNTPPPDPRRKRPDLPSACADLVMRCMARQREDRFATIEQVVSVFSAITLPVSAPALSSAQRIAVRPLSDPVQETRASVEHSPPPGDKTVAVLPFRNAGPKEDEYLAEELTDDLIDNLSMTRGLKVRSRGAVLKWRGVARDPRELGRELEVQVVVEGSVRRADGNVRLNVRLTSVADGFQLWAKRFDRPEKDVLSINDDAAASIAAALTLDRDAAVREAPSNPAAVDLYLRARHEYRKFWPDHQERAIDLFDQAESFAPGDPMILSGKALSMARRAFFLGVGAAQAVAVARQAVAAASNLAEGRLALGSALLQAGDAKGAVRELRHAVQRGPGIAEAHAALGRLLAEVGALHEGIRYLKNALALDPEAPLATQNLSRAYALLGDWARFDALDVDRGNSSAMMARARFAVWRRDLPRAKALLAEAKVSGQRPSPGLLMLEAILEGKVPTGVPFDPGWETPPPGTMQGGDRRWQAFRFQIEVEILALLGQFDEAFEKLQKSVEYGLIDLAWVDWCPLFVPMRQDPRFMAIRELVEKRAEDIMAAYRGA
jgi:serine/threonine-protein kinase